MPSGFGKDHLATKQAFPVFRGSLQSTRNLLLARCRFPFSYSRLVHSSDEKEADAYLRVERRWDKSCWLSADLLQFFDCFVTIFKNFKEQIKFCDRKNLANGWTQIAECQNTLCRFHAFVEYDQTV